MVDSILFPPDLPVAVDSTAAIKVDLVAGEEPEGRRVLVRHVVTLRRPLGNVGGVLD